MLALLKGLPVRDAACTQQDVPGWTVQDEMAAMHIEVTDGWNRMMASMWGAKKNQLPDAVVIKHPERDRLRGNSAKQQRTSLTGQKAFLDAVMSTKQKRR